MILYFLILLVSSTNGLNSPSLQPSPPSLFTSPLFAGFKTFAGTVFTGYEGDGGPATAAKLLSPNALWTDSIGQVYISDSAACIIRKVNTSGIITKIGGTECGGSFFPSFNSGPFTTAELLTPVSLWGDSLGLYIYVADAARILQYNAISGNATVFAGNGTITEYTDGIIAKNSFLNDVRGIWIDPITNDLFFCVGYTHTIRQINSQTTIINTFAGNGFDGFNGDGGPAIAATLSSPFGIWGDTLGNIFFTDIVNYCIRRISPEGIILTIGGNRNPGGLVDGVAATLAPISNPSFIVGDNEGTLYFTDPSIHAIRMLVPSTPTDRSNYMIYTIIGSGNQGGDARGIASPRSDIDSPLGLTLRFNYELLFTENNGRVRITFPAFNMTSSPSIKPTTQPTTLPTFVPTNQMTVSPSNPFYFKYLIAGFQTIAGGNGRFYFGDGGPATSAAINNPSGLWLDSLNQIYVADSGACVIRKISANSTISTVGGSTCANSAVFFTSGKFTTAALSSPWGMWGDSSGLYLYISDSFRIWRYNTISRDVISFSANPNGTENYLGDGRKINETYLPSPRGLWIDTKGNIYVSLYTIHKIRRIDGSNMIVSTVAGNGTPGFAGDGQPASLSNLKSPAGIWGDSLGNLFISDRNNYRVRRISSQGIITTICGNGIRESTGDGLPATEASLVTPHFIVGDTNGNLFVSDFLAQRIRLLVPLTPIDRTNYIIYTIVGTGFGGGTNAAASALSDISQPNGIILTSNYHLIFTESTGRLRMTYSNGSASPSYLPSPSPTFAPSFNPKNPDYFKYLVGGFQNFVGTGIQSNTGDGGQATLAGIDRPATLWLDRLGQLYFTDYAACVVRKVLVSGIITTLGGVPYSCFPTPFSKGSFSTAQLTNPWTVRGDASGLYLYITDFYRIWKYNTVLGDIEVLIGGTSSGFSPDGTRATNTTLIYNPRCVWIDSLNNLYFTETGNNMFRKISSLTNKITTIAGNITGSFRGDNGPASLALLSSPTGIWGDSFGNFLIGDQNNRRVRRISFDGIISTIAGNGQFGSAGDGGPATLAALRQPRHIVGDSNGNLYVSDFVSYKIRILVPLSPSNHSAYTIYTIVGTGNTFASPNAPVKATALSDIYKPNGLALTLDYRLLFTEDAARIRITFPNGTATPSTLPTMSPTVVPSIQPSMTSYPTMTPTTNPTVIPTEIPLAEPSTTNPPTITPTPIPSIQPSTKPPTKTPTATPTNTFLIQYLFARLDLFAGNSVSDSVGDGGPATSAGLSRAAGLWMDSMNQMYIVDYQNCNVRLVSANGIISTIGGSSTCPSGTMATNPVAPFTSVTMLTPWSVWGDTTGKFVYVSDFSRIWKYDTSTGIVSVFAGQSAAGYSGDGGPASQSSLNVVKGIYVDSTGDLYLTGNADHRIRRISASTEIITTVAGNGSSLFGGDGGLASRAALKNPMDVWVDSLGSIFIADNANHRIRKVSPPPLSIITTIGGNGQFTAIDGVTATSSGIRAPRGIKGDIYGRLYITESANNRIRMLVPSDDGLSSYIIYTIVGTGVFGSRTTPAFPLSPISSPNGLFITSDYHLYFSENILRVRFTSPNGSLPTVEPTLFPTFCPSALPSVFPSSSLPTIEPTLFPSAIPAPDPTPLSSNLFYEIDLVVGSGSISYNGDNLPAGTSTTVRYPAEIWVDSNGVVYFVDTAFCALRRISLSGIVTVLGGTIGRCGQINDSSGPFNSISMSSPHGLIGDTTGLSLYISDSTRVWKYNVSSGFAQQIAGKSGNFSSTGDGGSAANATFNFIRGLWLTTSQQLYISESAGNRVRRFDLTTNVITTFAGSGSTLGDNGPATLAEISAPCGVYAETNGLVFIADSSNHRIRRVSLVGIITTIAGGGTEPIFGQAATLTSLSFPRSIVGDGDGNLFVGSYGGNCVVHLRPLINMSTQSLDRSYIAYIVVGTGSAPSQPYSFPEPALSPIHAVISLWLTSSYNLYVNLPSRIIIAKANITSHPTTAPTNTIVPTVLPTLLPTYLPSLSPTFSLTAFPTNLPFYSDLFYQISLVVGNGKVGYNGNNLPAGTSTTIGRPSNIWVSTSGTLYFSDTNLCVVRKISSNGIVSVIGGNRTCQIGSSSGRFSSLSLQFPYSLVGDLTGENLYIGDGNVIWKNNLSTGFAEIIAGNLTQVATDGMEGSVTSIHFNSIRGLWMNTVNSLFVSDLTIYRIRVLNLASMTFKTVAGNGTNSFHGDNGPATLACISYSIGIWGDTNGNIFFADYGNNRVRRISHQGKITTVAGNGMIGDVEDAIPATSTQLNSPQGLAGDSLGNLYIAEYLKRVRLLVPNTPNNSSETHYTIYTIAGNGQCCGGNDLASALSPIGNVRAIWLTTTYNLYLAESQSRVRVITPRIPITSTPTSQPTFTGFRLGSTLFRQLRLIVGNGTAGYNGDNLPSGTSTQIRTSISLWADSKGDLYFSDIGNCLFRKIDSSTGLVTNIGGSPRKCGPDMHQYHAPLTSVILNIPCGIVGDTNGRNLYVGDASRIFRVDLKTMNATLLAGNSSVLGFSGDNHRPAIKATFKGIRRFWLNTNGILFITDQLNHCIRSISLQEETIVTVAGNGTSGFFGDSLSARGAMLSNPSDIFQDSNGILFISDSSNHRVRRVSVDGIISTIAGTGSMTYNGDQILATMASIPTPRGIRGDTNGNLYVASNDRIRSLQPVSTIGGPVKYVIDTVAGPRDSAATTSIYTSPPFSSLSVVYGLWLTTDYHLYLSDNSAQIRVLMPSFNITTPPSCFPTEIPSLLPSYLPSNSPSFLPSNFPTITPTELPTAQPSFTPTLMPTVTPSIPPSAHPSIIPTVYPSEVPSISPTPFPSAEPTMIPTIQPTFSPTFTPTAIPSNVPSPAPTLIPTSNPSVEPSILQSSIPTQFPSFSPTLVPTDSPTSTSFPSIAPTINPTVVPTIIPTVSPSLLPTLAPTLVPSRSPTIVPSAIPTMSPTINPTTLPTIIPTLAPTFAPSRSPTISPTVLPTFCPSLKPSSSPSSSPAPSLLVSYSPTFLSFTSTVTVLSPQPSRSLRFQGSSNLFGRTLSSMTSDVQTIDLSSSLSLSSSSAYILFGRAGSFPSSLDVRGIKDRLLYSKVRTAGRSYLKNDVITRSIANVGDINKDGMDDLLVGYPMSAMCFLYSGREDWINVPVTSVLYGGRSQGRLGWAVAGIGDMNNDGFKDVVVSAPFDGICYVIYGKTQLPASMQVSEVDSIVGGFKIVGSTTANNNFVAFGVAVSSAGDINGDGYSDLVISGFNMNSLCIVYVIYGSSNSANIILDGTLKLDPSRGFRVVGTSLSFVGFSLASVGDVNADGFDDIAMNSMIYSMTTNSFTTERIYILFGNNTLFPSGELFLTSVARYNITVIENAGFMMGNAGDLNQDGIPDLMMISFIDWMTRANSYILTYPSNYTSNPTTAPSSYPTGSPSYQPSSSPSSSRPSCSPSVSRTVFPTSCPSIFSPTLHSNDSTAPIAPTALNPTFRRSIVPSAKPTRNPSTIRPSTTPTKLPTCCPSIQPQSPSVTPSRPPSKAPTFSPSAVPTNPPTGRPSLNLMPTSTPSSVPTNSQSTLFTKVTVSAAGKYVGDEGKKQLFIITSPSGTSVTIVGKRGIKIYMIYPPTKIAPQIHSLSSPLTSSATITKVVIRDFDVNTDVLDFSQISSMRSLADLTYSTSPLTIRLLDSELLVILSSHVDFDLLEKNFVFANGETSESTNSKFTLVDSSVIVPAVALVGCLLATYFILHRYSNKSEKGGSKVADVVAVSNGTEKEKENPSINKIKEELIPEISIEDLEKQSPGLVRRHLERKRVLTDAVPPQQSQSFSLPPLSEYMFPSSHSSSDRSSWLNSNESASFSQVQGSEKEEANSKIESNRHTSRSLSLMSFESMRSRFASFMSYELSDEGSEGEENNSQSEISNGSDDNLSEDELSFFSSY